MPSVHPRVLFFDDDFESMASTKEYLERERGWSVELSAERTILDRLKRERFDLILVDIMIRPASLDAAGGEVENVHFDGVPWQMTGIEFLKRLRRGDFGGATGQGTRADVPVIIVSAIADDSVVDAFDNSVMLWDYQGKPFRIEYLLAHIDQLLKW